MGKSGFFRLFLSLGLGLALSACSGALEGPLSGALDAPGAAVGGVTPGGSNLADGTLSSQSGYQELDNGCGFELTLRFSGEEKEVDNWLLLGSDPAYFPQATIGKVLSKDQEFQACADCQGRILRVVDLGEVPGDFHTVQEHFLQMFGWSMNLKLDKWDPELLPASSYRDFLIEEKGTVDLSGQSMLAEHLYYFLVSRQVQPAEEGEKFFASMQEFNDMASCAKSPASSPETQAPFTVARLVHVLDKAPIELKPIPIPQGGESENNLEVSKKIIQSAPLHQSIPTLQVSP